MRRNRIHIRPSRVDHANLDSLSENINDEWEEKARRLQARRWRALKRSVKGE